MLRNSCIQARERLTRQGIGKSRFLEVCPRLLLRNFRSKTYFMAKLTKNVLLFSKTSGLLRNLKDRFNLSTELSQWYTFTSRASCKVVQKLSHLGLGTSQIYSSLILYSGLFNLWITSYLFKWNSRNTAQSFIIVFSRDNSPIQPKDFTNVFTWRHMRHRVFSHDVTAAMLVSQTNPLFLRKPNSFVPTNLHRCWPREWKHSMVSQTWTFSP